MGEVAYYDWGTQVEPKELRHSLAQGFISAVQENPTIHPLGTFQNGDQEAIVFDLEVDRPTRPVYPIMRVERLAVILHPEPTKMPECIALRKDFPDDTPHQNLVPLGQPRSLCLYEIPFSELRLSLTPPKYLRRVAEWLARACVGKLHLENQRLEPFVITPFKLVTDELFGESIEFDNILVMSTLGEEESPVFHAIRIPKTEKDIQKKAEKAAHVLLPLQGKPSDGVVIRHHPSNLDELHGLLSKAGIDLLDAVRRMTQELGKSEGLGEFVRKRWLFHVRLPKVRQPGVEYEDTEDFAFVVSKRTIGDMGVDLGVLGKEGDNYVPLIGEGEDPKMPEALIDVMEPISPRSRSLARRIQPAKPSLPKDPVSITAIGAGALGSRIAINIARRGVGTWTIVDPDAYLPHNVFRHAVPVHYVGWNKARATADAIQNLLNEEGAARGLALDALTHEEGKGDVFEAFRKALIIGDFTASRAMIYSIASADCSAPRFSSYLTADAQYLIALWEGKDRALRLDDLDVQLAQAATEDPRLAQIFATQSGPGARYGGSCSAVTSRISADMVDHHAATASEHLIGRLTEVSPSITIWTLSSETLGTVRVDVPVHSVRTFHAEGWEIRVNEEVLTEIRRLRQEGLPEETGGVLIGTFDLARMRIFVVKALPCPPDSVTEETGFVRGVEGLAESYKELTRRSGYILQYVGEWHSHPKGCPAKPSLTDVAAFGILTETMLKDGYPALFIIQGDEPDPCFVLGIEWPSKATQ